VPGCRSPSDGPGVADSCGTGLSCDASSTSRLCRCNASCSGSLGCFPGATSNDQCHT
jgi:hypothetical protein